MKHSPEQYVSDLQPPKNAAYWTTFEGCGSFGKDYPCHKPKKWYSFPTYSGYYCFDCAFHKCQAMEAVEKRDCANIFASREPSFSDSPTYSLEDVFNVSEEAMNIRYTLIRKKTGKRYIGYSTVGTKRFWYHQEDAFTKQDDREIYRDMRTDGISGFDWLVDEVFPDTLEGLEAMKDAEKREIARYVNSGIRLYNGTMTVRWSYGPHAGPDMDNPYIVEKVPDFDTATGDSFVGWRQTEEQKKHLSKVMHEKRKKALPVTPQEVLTERLVETLLEPENPSESIVVPKRPYRRCKPSVKPPHRFSAQERRIVVLLSRAGYHQRKIALLVGATQGAISKLVKKMGKQ